MFWLHNDATNFVVHDPNDPNICVLVINTTMEQLVITH